MERVHSTDLQPLASRSGWEECPPHRRQRAVYQSDTLEAEAVTGQTRNPALAGEVRGGGSKGIGAGKLRPDRSVNLSLMSVARQWVQWMAHVKSGHSPLDFLDSGECHLSALEFQVLEAGQLFQVRETGV
jgi:hypothetical protein